MKLKPSLFLFFLAVLSLTGCNRRQDPTLTVLRYDYEARKQLKAEHFEEALQNYYNIVQVYPNDAGPHSNIGVILNMVQKPEEALKSLEQALELAKQNHDSAAEFAVQYNMGWYFTGLKKIDEALEHYQAALEVKPSSIETKTNIELLIQQNKQGQNGEKSDDQSKQDQDKKDQKPDEGKSGQDNKDQKDKNKDQKDQDKKDDKKDGDQDKEQKPDDGKKRENSPKYKPRQFNGEQLSEGDVKKILGELRNQEQKIRANFEKKEKGKTRRNEKDW
jgi:tetratricopeptide (TPR) repeat protein